MKERSGRPFVVSGILCKVGMVAREDVACWVCLMVGTCFQEAESNLVVRSLQAGCRKSKL